MLIQIHILRGVGNAKAKHFWEKQIKEWTEFESSAQVGLFLYF